MVRDRLQELRQARHSLTPSELAVQGLSASGDPFLDRVAQMRQSVEEIDRLIRQMLRVQESVLGQSVVRPEDKDQLDTLIEQIRQRATALRSNVRRLEEELAEEGQQQRDANRRIRQNQSDQLRRRLNEVLETFHSAQEEYRQRVTRRVRRQLELAGEHLGPGEVERLLEDQTEQIFYRHISPVSIAAQMALEDASSRHSELLRLEKSISELADCFQDMFQLVHCQGALVDRIETNIEAATEYTGQARVQMHRAVAYKQSAQRLKCIIVLVVIGVLLLLLLLLAFWVLPAFHVL